MKISKRKITWMSIGFTVTLLAGAPAVADDTELLLVNPDPSLTPKPNVMFILDTSGSMTTTQPTTEPYDSLSDYLGNCDITNLFWTDVDVTHALHRLSGCRPCWGVLGFQLDSCDVPPAE